MKSLGCLMTIDQAIEFYKRCQELKAETQEQRLLILAQMVKERRAFPQTEEQLKKRLDGKKILVVKNKETKETKDDKPERSN